jgi:hypothetical protein
VLFCMLVGRSGLGRHAVWVVAAHIAFEAHIKREYFLKFGRFRGAGPRSALAGCGTWPLYSTPVPVQRGNRAGQKTARCGSGAGVNR